MDLQIRASIHKARYVALGSLETSKYCTGTALKHSCCKKSFLNCIQVLLFQYELTWHRQTWDEREFEPNWQIWCIPEALRTFFLKRILFNTFPCTTVYISLVTLFLISTSTIILIFTNFNSQTKLKQHHRVTFIRTAFLSSNQRK
jgi:hypothetical protein